jgi:hypothetical protein
MCLETNVRLLRAESRGEYLFQIQTDIRGPIAGEAGGGTEAGSFAGVRVAESNAGTGSSAVLSRQLKAGFKGPLLLSVDLCNKAATNPMRGGLRTRGHLPGMVLAAPASRVIFVDTAWHEAYHVLYLYEPHRRFYMPGNTLIR